MTFSDRLKHFFHVVSNVRPIVWICLYLLLVPVFALFYYWLPVDQFRGPDGPLVDYGSCLYYSIVTLTTLGFGDYTPVLAGAQCITAVEVLLGLVVIGFFLNAVGSMKSEIDVTSEIEKQKALHEAQEKEKLLKNIPILMHNLNIFLSYCYAVTTPLARRTDTMEYNEDFLFSDMADMYKPSGLPASYGSEIAIEGLLKSSARTALCLDSMQSRIDMTLWPDLLESGFSFVADYQMFASSDALAERIELKIREGKAVTPTEAEKKVSEEIAGMKAVPDAVSEPKLVPYVDLYNFIKKNAVIARDMQIRLTSIAS